MKGVVNFDELCRIPDDRTRNLFITIYVHCNEDGEWHTSLKELEMLTGMTEWDIRKRLSQMNGSLTALKLLSNRGRCITLVESSVYILSKEMPLKLLSNSSQTEKEEKPKKRVSAESFAEAAKRVYDAYPTKDKISGRSTGKSLSKDTAKIERLLKSKAYTEDKLISVIKQYLDESEKTDTYIKNFSTFLNNIPDYDDVLDISSPSPCSTPTIEWQ